jgi:hypothetical protein
MEVGDGLKELFMAVVYLETLTFQAIGRIMEVYLVVAPLLSEMAFMMMKKTF